MFPNLGLEPTPDLFVEHMVEIFREIRRVLRDDGVVWMNLGDCFAGSGGENANTGLQGGNTIKANSEDGTRSGLWRSNPRKTKIAQGNLMLMPHRVAIALQDDGWIIRQDLVWYKRNPMPESVNGWRFQEKSCDCGTEAREKALAITMKKTGTERHRALYMDGHHGTNWTDPDCPNCSGTGKIGDPELKKGSWRHTRAHEYVFQLTKQMGYWSNQEAVRETNIDPSRTNYQSGARTFGLNHDRNDNDLGERSKEFTASGRNPRSVLDVPTAPYKHAHYATYPPNLIAPLIRATCPRWACPVCGQGWSPVVEKSKPPWNEDNRKHEEHKPTSATKPSGPKLMEWINANPPVIKAYRPTCDHKHTIEEAVPGIVLDPFLGSGTTGAVARELQLRWIGLDISLEYLDLQAKVRTKSGSPSNELEGLPLFERGNDNVG